MTYYQYPQRTQKAKQKRRKLPRWKREREINPDTGKPFRDRRSELIHGRVICRGADMKDLRERVGQREKETCQRCEALAEIYPPETRLPGELHHIKGRGMGSGKRNDVASECEWLCGECHRAEHGLRRSRAA